jgi:structural maintenance of chromosome 2
MPACLKEPVTLEIHSALQVLNMKPAEVLGMLEEAAGTRMYENKKEAALRTLEKKQVKVDEINKVGSQQ